MKSAKRSGTLERAESQIVPDPSLAVCARRLDYGDLRAEDNHLSELPARYAGNDDQGTKLWQPSRATWGPISISIH